MATLPSLTALAGASLDSAADQVLINDDSASTDKRATLDELKVGMGLDATASPTFAAITVTTATATTANVSALRPASNDGAALGDTTHQFSDLFLAEGGVINWDNGDATLTQAGNVVTLAGADLVVPNLTNSALTSGRVVIAGASGLLADDADLTFATDTLTATKIGAFTTAGNITFVDTFHAILDIALADNTSTGVAIPGTAGASLTFGDAIYLDPTDSKWEKTDANAAAGADGDCRGLVGVCVLTAAEDAATRILIHGTVRADTPFPSFTVGAPVYFSESAGILTSTAPVTTDSVTRAIGWAVDANTVYVSPAASFITHT